MSGVQFLVDDRGRRTAVLIDLRKNAAIWEDFYDRVTAQARTDEPRESLSVVKRHLQRIRKLHA